MNTREQWSTRIGFILASAGAAIGLGAIWKFPYVTGMNGGGAFFLLFIAFTVLIGLPMLIAEFIIGRGSRKELSRHIRALRQIHCGHLLVSLVSLAVFFCFHSIALSAAGSCCMASSLCLEASLEMGLTMGNYLNS